MADDRAHSGAGGKGVCWGPIVVNRLLAALGVWLLLGHTLTLALPKLNRGGADGTYTGMYLFGVSYALASLSCTIGVFTGATSLAFRAGSYVSTVAVCRLKRGSLARSRNL